MSLVKLDIINKLTEELGLTKSESKSFVDQFFSLIKEGLISKEEIRLSGFGNFFVKDKKDRPARNPKTGEQAMVSARTVTVFKAGNKLRRQIQLKGELNE